MLDIFCGCFSHIIRQTSEHVVVLHRLLHHLHPLPPHGEHGPERIHLVHLDYKSETLKTLFHHFCGIERFVLTTFIFSPLSIVHEHCTEH